VWWPAFPCKLQQLVVSVDGRHAIGINSGVKFDSIFRWGSANPTPCLFIASSTSVMAEDVHTAVAYVYGTKCNVCGVGTVVEKSKPSTQEEVTQVSVLRYQIEAFWVWKHVTCQTWQAGSLTGCNCTFGNRSRKKRGVRIVSARSRREQAISAGEAGSDTSVA